MSSRTLVIFSCDWCRKDVDVADDLYGIRVSSAISDVIAEYEVCPTCMERLNELAKTLKYPEES